MVETEACSITMTSRQCKLKLVDIELTNLTARLDAIKEAAEQASLSERERGVERAFGYMDSVAAIIKDCNCEEFGEGFLQLREEWETHRTDALRERARSDALESKTELARLLRLEESLLDVSNPAPPETTEDQTPNQAWSLEHSGEGYMSGEFSACSVVMPRQQTVVVEASETQDEHLKDRIADLTLLLEKAELEISKLKHERRVSDDHSQNVQQKVVATIKTAVANRRQEAEVNAAFERGRAFERRCMHDEYSSWRIRCEEAEKSYMEIYRGRITRPQTA